MMHQIIDQQGCFITKTTAETLDQKSDHLGFSGPDEVAALPPRKQPRHIPAATGAAYWGPGSQMTFLITGKDTGGAFFMAEMSVPPGGGPPPHIHQREDESFHMLEGTMTIQVGGDTITASSGDFVYLPRGVVHSFRNTGTATARALVLVTPAGLENFFAEVFEPAADRYAPPPAPTKELIARSMAASARYGLVLLPPA
jgi:quercetin dioxygenase-like cupin family protein